MFIKLKLKFHGTDTDTDFLADFCATILARAEKVDCIVCPVRLAMILRKDEKLAR